MGRKDAGVVGSASQNRRRSARSSYFPRLGYEVGLSFCLQLTVNGVQGQWRLSFLLLLPPTQYHSRTYIQMV